MEVKEAADLLDNLVGMVEDSNEADYDTALRMGIEALTSKPTGCISRQAAIDIFDDYNVSVENGELEAYSRDRKRLCDLPSAQPEPKCANGCIYGWGSTECEHCALKSAQPEQLERCPIYGGVCGYPSDQCYECPRYSGAQPEQQWIPCSERLPEPESEEQRRGFYFTTNGYGSVGVTRYEFYDDFFQKTGWQCDIRIDAWMPLPEPWRGEDDAQQDCP